MEPSDTDRLGRLARGVVELGLTLALLPLKALLRHLLPATTPIDQERWAPAEDAPAVGDVPVATERTVGAEVHVEAPWPEYDTLTVGQVVERLGGADPATRAMVRLYEETHKNRKGVLRATE